MIAKYKYQLNYQVIIVSHWNINVLQKNAAKLKYEKSDILFAPT